MNPTMKLQGLTRKAASVEAPNLFDEAGNAEGEGGGSGRNRQEGVRARGREGRRAGGQEQPGGTTGSYEGGVDELVQWTSACACLRLLPLDSRTLPSYSLLQPVKVIAGRALRETRVSLVLCLLVRVLSLHDDHLLPRKMARHCELLSVPGSPGARNSTSKDGAQWR